MNKELIEKLQDKTYVRAFGLMTREEQACFEKVGKKNCLYYSVAGWDGAETDFFVNISTYAIKPDYQPEPEYWDCEIERIGRLLMVRPLDGMGDILTGPTAIHKLPSLPDFHSFWHIFEDEEFDLNIVHVSSEIDVGNKVYARFRT